MNAGDEIVIINLLKEVEKELKEISVQLQDIKDSKVKKSSFILKLEAAQKEQRDRVNKLMQKRNE